MIGVSKWSRRRKGWAHHSPAATSACRPIAKARAAGDMRPDCDRMKLSWVTAPEFYVRAAVSASRIAAAPNAVSAAGGS